jgi:hypothetical protein
VVFFQLIMTETESWFNNALENGYWNGSIELDAIPTCRVIPTCLYMAFFFFACSYYARLNSDLTGGRLYLSRYVFGVVYAASFILMLFFMFIMKNQVLVELNFILFKTLLFLLIIWYAVGLINHFKENPRGGAQQKIMDRFYLFSVVILVFLFFGVGFHCIDVYQQRAPAADR